MTRKCCRTQSPDRNTCSREADTIILFASKKRCFELMLFLMVSACRRGILAALEAEVERAGGLVRGDEVFACVLFFLQMHWESLSQASHLHLKWVFPFHVTAARFAGSFPPGSLKIVKNCTNETTPRYSLDTCLAFLQGGIGTSMCTGAKMHCHKHMGRGHLQKGHEHAVEAAKSPSMAGWRTLWAPAGKVCSGSYLVSLWLHRA